MNAVARPILMTDEEFDRFVATGASAALGRVELRGGALVKRSPQYIPHGRCKDWMFRQVLSSLVTAGLKLDVNSEVTVRFDGGFQPLPDLTIWTGDVDRGAIPGDRVRLVVEVSDRSLADDLGEKRASYAATGLPEYWVLDVNARAVHRFHAPAGDTFTKADIIRDGERLDSATLPGVGFTLDLPR